MSHWWFCCRSRPCVICNPAIWSPVRDDISDIFDERSGDWEIVDESTPPPTGEDNFVLQENGNAGAVATCLTPHPLSTPTGKAFATIFDIQDGRKYRVIINYNPIDGAYLFTELETLGAGSATLKVGSSSDGILDTATVGYSQGETHDITVCRTLTGLYASSQDSTIVVWDCIESWNGGRYAGVGNGGSGVIQFSAFQFNEHTYTYQIGNCATCPCECGEFPPGMLGINGCLPKEFLLTFTASGDCKCLDGEEIILTLVPTIGRDPRTWAGSKVLCDGNTYSYELTCIGVAGFSLCDLSDLPCGGFTEENCSLSGSEGSGGVNDSFSCNPIVITWIPGSCQPADVTDPNCYVTITVTEVPVP